MASFRHLLFLWSLQVTPCARLRKWRGRFPRGPDDMFQSLEAGRDSLFRRHSCEQGPAQWRAEARGWGGYGVLNTGEKPSPAGREGEGVNGGVGDYSQVVRSSR